MTSDNPNRYACIVGYDAGDARWFAESIFVSAMGDGATPTEAVMDMMSNVDFMCQSEREQSDIVIWNKPMQLPNELVIGEILNEESANAK